MNTECHYVDKSHLQYVTMLISHIKRMATFGFISHIYRISPFGSVIYMYSVTIWTIQLKSDHRIEDLITRSPLLNVFSAKYIDQSIVLLFD